MVGALQSIDMRSPERRGEGCVAWRGCAPGGQTVYCEGGGSHSTWPDRNATLIEFFTNAAVRPM
jgi:polyhydroxybutyrate depolymerase